MLPMFLAVVDQTIVATALPAIAASLGDVHRLSWVVVAYLVATTIAAPVYGRLGDVLGRRRLMFIALGIFMAASVICALSREHPDARGGPGPAGCGWRGADDAIAGARRRGHPAA